MRQAVSQHRFRAVITREGAIIVPPESKAGLKSGQPVWVVIERAGGAVEAPDEQEVAAIAALQSEHPDTIRRCLRAQGSLARGRSHGAKRKAARR
jgi:hypothetical protein